MIVDSRSSNNVDQIANIEDMAWQAGKFTVDDDECEISEPEKGHLISDSPMKLADDAELIDHRPQKEEAPGEHH